jgi:hypothetical protein
MHHTDSNRILSLGVFRAFEYSSKYIAPERFAGDAKLHLRKVISMPGAMM